MKKYLLSLAILALFSVAPRAARGADVSVDFFYNNLPGGSWMEIGDYGYCWQPDAAAGNSEWRPYADGYWAYTDLGWTWVSYEDFGWATYHYGRWAHLSDYGWVWVPGRDADLEWGPAWVSWRTGGEYIGWAPLPPATIGLVEGSPIRGHLDVEFDIGPACYNFIDVRYIGEPVLRERIVPVAQNVTYIQKTVNVTNITYQNKIVYNYGPDINVVNRTSMRPIQRLKLDREQNVDLSAAIKSGGLTKVQGNKLVVAAPMRITKSTVQVGPPAVKIKVEKARIDHGWSVVGDAKAQEEFKQRIKNQNLDAVPSAGGSAVNVPPSTATGEGGNRNRRLEGQTSGQTAASTPVSGIPASASTSTPGQSNTAEGGSLEQGQGHRGRRLEGQNPNASTGTGSEGGNGEAQGANGRQHKQRQETGVQATGNGEKRQGNEPERHNEKTGKTSPAPTPQ